MPGQANELAVRAINRRLRVFVQSHSSLAVKRVLNNTPYSAEAENQFQASSTITNGMVCGPSNSW